MKACSAIVATATPERLPVGGVADEGGAVLGVEGVGDRLGECPAEHGQVQRAAAAMAASEAVARWGWPVTPETGSKTRVLHQVGRVADDDRQPARACLREVGGLGGSLDDHARHSQLGQQLTDTEPDLTPPGDHHVVTGGDAALADE